MNPQQKRRRRIEKPYIVDPRDAFVVANRLRLLRMIVPPPVLTQYEDRRLYHPNRIVRGAFSFRRPDSRLVDRSRSFRAKTVLGFAVPKRVAVCVRRKTRREVLLAKGRGGGRNRRPRRNEWSNVSCRS